jgi:hypothetical protein
MTSSTHYHDGAMVIDCDDMVCGGGAQCPYSDGPAYGPIFVEHGKSRCGWCALRLGWVQGGSTCEWRRSFGWRHNGTRPAWLGAPIRDAWHPSNHR